MNRSTLISREQLYRLVQIAIQAGNALMAYYDDEVDISVKDDNTPLTAADLASHQTIVNALAAEFGQFPILSEEDADISWQQRATWQHYWLLDPLDGTKEFIKHNGEFTVNIALVSQHMPVAGVVYAPALGRCFFGMVDVGAWELAQPAMQRVPDAATIAQRSQSLLGQTTRQTPIVVGSRSHITPGLAGFLGSLVDYHLREVGSSLKMCLLASAEADLYPRLGATHEWDTAAAHAILSAAGGHVLLHDSQQPLRYNTKNTLANPWFVAYRPGWIEDTP
ncbi:3'(2'),5'-bisphosphate nucleotidase CysQ [Shewanella sp.]|uniref:3'(2'),5'-bisphosphate nucleotidase CysQ n=1 Tax=Shewanella sp. TaxID=50422 RepID=UPI003A97CFB0